MRRARALATFSRARLSLRPARALLLALALTLLLAVAGCGSGASSAATSSVKPRSVASASAVAARVNGHDVPSSAVADEQRTARLTGSTLTAAQALEQAIDTELIRQQSVRLGLTVKPSEVAAREAEVAAQLGGISALATALKQAGIDQAQFDRGISQVLLSEKVQNAMFPKITATLAEARAYFKQNGAQLNVPASVNLGEILVPAIGIAKSAVKRIQEGEPFDVAARQFSTDPEGAAAGGSLGWVVVDSMPTPLAKVVATLPIGVLSKPVAGPGGFYLFKVFARRPGKVYTFAEVSSEISQMLTSQERSAKLAAWVKQTRAHAQVTIVK